MEKHEIQELLDFATHRTDFNEVDIEKRNSDIINGFMEYLKNNELAQ